MTRHPDNVREALEALAEDGTLARHDQRDGSFVITVKGPLGENLGQNARVHWRVKATATKAARGAWWVAAMTKLTERVDEIPYERLRITYRAYFCRKRWTSDDPFSSYGGYRPTDADGLVGAMKPALDGLKDAALFLDDDASRVTLGTPSITWLESFGKERVEILVEPTLPSGPDR